eukprot:TRINITY_DN2355_c0_g1_i3.p1 TRINITY_DN2355_c0_g1~~TRINITY_DN2355_c0_g1_i3.p1  ORF type:complete len:658 (-),score=163.94 TRINITY_DN2355_c0_g1_i3:312-2285(-)
MLELLAPPGMSMMPARDWTALFVSIESYFRPAGEGDAGTLDFFHRQLAKAVQRRYLEDPAVRIKYQKELAAYFAKTPMSERRMLQQPFYHKETKDWVGLRDCLSDVDGFFLLYTERHKFELLAYWRQLKEIDEKFSPDKCFQETLKTYNFVSYADSLRMKSTGDDLPRTRAYVYRKIAELLDDLSIVKGAEEFAHLSLEEDVRTQGADAPSSAYALRVMSRVQFTMSKYGDAVSSAKRALEIRLKAFGENNVLVAESYEDLAMVVSRGTHADGSLRMECISKSLSLTQLLLGVDSPEYVARAIRLAGIYGGFSLSQLFQLLKQSEALFGQHPTTAIVYANIGKHYKSKPPGEEASEGDPHQNPQDFFDKTAENLPTQLAGKSSLQPGASVVRFGSQIPGKIVAFLSTPLRYLADFGEGNIEVFEWELMISQDLVPAPSSIDVGARVEVNWRNRGTLYPGKISKKEAENAYFISFDDGDQEGSVPLSRIFVRNTAPQTAPIPLGARVKANWKGRGTLYPGKVTQIQGERYAVSFDDGDFEDQIERARIFPDPMPVGQKQKATIFEKKIARGEWVLFNNEQWVVVRINPDNTYNLFSASGKTRAHAWPQDMTNLDTTPIQGVALPEGVREKPKTNGELFLYHMGRCISLMEQTLGKKPR